MNSKSTVNGETYGEYDAEGELQSPGLPQRRDQPGPGHPGPHRPNRRHRQRQGDKGEQRERPVDADQRGRPGDCSSPLASYSP